MVNLENVTDKMLIEKGWETKKCGNDVKLERNL